MIRLTDYISEFPFHEEQIFGLAPWQIVLQTEDLIMQWMISPGEGYLVSHQVAVHESAEIEPGAIIKAPAVIGPGCFIGANAYLRGGVFLGAQVVIGPGCEVKSSILCRGTAVAHFNFIGNSLIGSGVNFEAGSVVANHHNDRADKRIFVRTGIGQVIDTGVTKFGALVGDRCKIGANAVLSPGTLLLPDTVVNRLALIEPV